jgi:alpha-tubulin suppressor-like RCC1 family protein
MFHPRLIAAAAALHLVGQSSAALADPASDAAKFLLNFDAQIASLEAIVPDRFLFQEGETGASINDGGNDMYDNGNAINTNLAANIPYTNGVVTDGAAQFGPGSYYVTKKYPAGFFLFAAFGTAVENFSISGNLGADGGGTTMAGRLTEAGENIFFKKVYNAGDPSVNHLVFFPGAAAEITQTAAASTDDDSDSFTGVGGVQFIAYLLFAGNAGKEYSAAELTAIASQAMLTMNVTASNAHSCALVGASVKCWGNGESGQLGLGDANHRGDEAGEMGAALPAVNLGAGFSAASVAVGGRHSCAVSTEGRVKCWGANDKGQLGLGDRTDRGLTPDSMGNALPYVDLGSDFTAASVALGGNHTCVLSTDRRVKCFGAGDAGQLGVGDSQERGGTAGSMGDALPELSIGAGVGIVQVAVGGKHTCVLGVDEFVRCFGDNSYGQLGAAVDGNLGDAPEETGDLAQPVANLPERFVAVKVTAGSKHTCLLSRAGQALCFGANEAGQLGVGDQLRRGGAAGAALLPVDLGSGQFASDLSCGATTCCARLVQSTLKCWGNNNKGQLGLGDTVSRGGVPATMGDYLPFVAFEALASITKVTLGGGHACATLATGAIKCWGDNTDGQLGYGDTISRGASMDLVPMALPAIDLGN